MKLKKILLTGLSLVTVAAISVGGTLAFLQNTDSDVNVMTLGNVKIEQVEQERNASGELVEFTQNKPLYPYVGEIAWDDNQININGHDYNMFGEKLKNAVDKIVSVKNTGKSDAYVRTWIALEDPFDTAMIGVNVGGVGYTQSGWITATIDGVQYSVTCFTYNEALKPGEVSLPSLLQVYLKYTATNEDVALLGDTYEILAFSQAVQAKGFADAKTALDEAFDPITVDNHPWVNATQKNVDNDAALKDALQNKDASTIIVNLTDDVTYDVAAWAVNGMGGEKTDLIVINGNGNTINFNQTNSDWNNIVTNGAKLVINNANITNSGNNNGPWNRHDLNFACEVELNNVVSDKALAFKAGATLNNVTINDANTSDTYAIWIQPNGQTVTLNGCTIDMLNATDGRGIKIDEQYVDAPEKVTLNVSNTTFKTEEKSAILVKSVAGADINLSNIDIYGVKSDPINAVWVDEASASYADLVVVNGGKKIVEGEIAVVSATNKADLKSNLSDAIAAGETNIVVNAEGADIGNLEYGLNTKIVPAGTTVTIANANTKGWNYGNAVAGTVVFENCTFDSDSAYSIHFDAGGGNVIFNNCTLSGWCSFGTAIKSVEMNNCTINGNGIYSIVRCYQNAVLTNCTIDCSNTNTTDVYQDGLDIVEGYTMTLENCTNVNGEVQNLFEQADIDGTDGKIIIK